jgi:dihydrodipicolinate synthase/N-acetylneuraminate lyase
MRTRSVRLPDWHAVFAVPPLARRRDSERTIDLAENDRLLRHILAGGVTNLIWGGNAFVYHVTLAEYQRLLEWLTGTPDEVWAIPSLGPSYGRAIDQAAMLRAHRFPTAMLLPCNDPRDASGLEHGVREIAEEAGIPLMLYLKEEDNFGRDLAAGLDAVARLVDSGVVAGIKYAVVRTDAARDPYLEALLARVDRRYVISGMGERPAVVHLRQFALPGFTTGSGCVAPASSQAILDAATAGQWDVAEARRTQFLPLEDVRDQWGPARVLHAAVEDAGIANTGPVPPFVTELPANARDTAAHAARTLLASEALQPR